MKRWCTICKESFVSNGKRVTCSPTCARVLRWRAKNPIPIIIQCAVCGNDIRRVNSTMRVCQERCSPYDGMEQECVQCHVPKPYAEFHDYRGDHDNGRMHTACIECQNKGSLESWRKTFVTKSTHYLGQKGE